MIQTNIKSDRKDRGFTIVELLVVIVVIGILAAITIVSYTGITARAKTAQAQSNAQSIQSVAEVYFTEHSFYPVLTGDFASTVAAKVPSGVSIAKGFPGTSGGFTGTMSDLWGTTITSANFPTTVTWACSGGTAAAGACAGNTGGRITYYDFQTSTQSTTIYYVGAASVASTFFAPAS